SQLPPADYSPIAFVAVDWDRDIDLDLLLPGPKGEAAGYLENLRHGQFRWRRLEPGFEALAGSKAVELFDVGQRGSWNLLAAGDAGVSLLQTDTSRSGVVTPKPAGQLSATPCNGLVTCDF